MARIRVPPAVAPKQRCPCPDLPEDTRCFPPSNHLQLRLYQALNSQDAWDELVCFLDNVCEGLNAIPSSLVGKDTDGSPLVSKPTDTDALLAGQPAYIDASGFARPAGFSALKAEVFGLALAAIGAMDAGCLVTSGRLQLSDWTAVAGSTLLTTGKVYYLTASGGLTDTIPSPPAEAWNVRVGIACSGDTLQVDLRPPIQLVC